MNPSRSFSSKDLSGRKGKGRVSVKHFAAKHARRQARLTQEAAADDPIMDDAADAGEWARREHWGWRAE